MTDYQVTAVPGDENKPRPSYAALERTNVALKKRIAELEAELATLKARHSGTKEQLIAVANERDEGRLHIADLERLLRAALAENPTWHSDAAVEAERVLDAAGESDEPDGPAVIDVPGKGRVRIQTDDTEAERVRRELDRRVKEAEEE